MNDRLDFSTKFVSFSYEMFYNCILCTITLENTLLVIASEIERDPYAHAFDPGYYNDIVLFGSIF